MITGCATWPDAFVVVGVAWAIAFGVWAVAKCFGGGWLK